MTDAQRLREAYADLLAMQDWDLFTTATYAIQRRDPIRAAGRLWSVLSEKFDADRAFVAVEYHRLGGLHCHALSRHATRPRLAGSSVSKYLEKAFGFATCETPRSSSASLVTAYCSKYVLKDGGLDNYHFFGDTWNRG